MYLLTAWEPTSVAITTCSSLTNFDARIMLFENIPRPEGASMGTNSTLLAESEATGECATIFYDLSIVGSYFIVVEGHGEQEGLFELAVICNELYSAPVSHSLPHNHHLPSP